MLEDADAEKAEAGMDEARDLMGAKYAAVVMAVRLWRHAMRRLRERNWRWVVFEPKRT